MEATIWYEFQDRHVYKQIVEIVVLPETMILMLRLGCEDIVSNPFNDKLAYCGA